MRDFWQGGTLGLGTMIRLSFIGSLTFFSTALAWGAITPNSVVVDNSEGLVISAEAHCVQSRGIPIKEVPDNEVKVACLRDKNVQMACNPDGAHARSEAFRQWTAQVMEFRDRCASVGGQFAYADSQFQEPSDSSFCSIAQPEVQYSEFETPMCNFVSRCPSIAVTCTKTEEILHTTPRIVALPGIPKPISLASH